MPLHALRARRRRLRTQIAALVAGVSCLLAPALGLLAARTSAHHRLDHSRFAVLSELDAAMTSLAATGNLNFVQSSARLRGADAIALDDPEVPGTLARHVARGRSATEFVDTGGGPVLWAAAGFDGHTLSVRRDYTHEERDDDRFNQAVLMFSAVGAGVASLAGLLLAAPLARRIRLVSRTARSIADGQLDARIGNVRGAREVAELAASVDQMAAALQDRLHAEQRFAADVAHELRNPAAGMLAAAEILPPSRGTELIRERVERLCELIDELLEVSRLDADADAVILEPHHPAEQLRRLVASTGLEVRVQIRDDPVVMTDQRRLERIVANLVINAHRHGAAPVTLTLSKGVITVRDSGPGFPPDLLDLGPRPFRTGARRRGKGTGLGLTIATGHARQIKARLEFANPPEGGAVATLTLPLETTHSRPSTS